MASHSSRNRVCMRSFEVLALYFSLFVYWLIYLCGALTHYGKLLGLIFFVLLFNCLCFTQTETGLNKEISDSGANGRRPDISLQVPPRPLGFGSTAGGKVLDHSQSFSKGRSSPKGFLRVLSFKRKVNVAADGERSSLLNSDPKTAAESTSMTSISEIPWSRCNSLPVSHAPNLSPSVAATPVSARTYNEQQIKPHVSPLLFHWVSLFVDFQICWLYSIVKFKVKSHITLTNQSVSNTLSKILSIYVSTLYQKVKDETDHMWDFQWCTLNKNDDLLIQTRF